MQHECRYLHAMMFGREPSRSVIERYEEAHRKLGVTVKHPQQIAIEKIIRLELDAEAIELALRSTTQPHLLTIKCRILAYVAETSDDFYQIFVNDEQIWWGRAALAIGLQAIRTAIKKLKGKINVRRYHL